jgi:hypothetical protein
MMTLRTLSLILFSGLLLVSTGCGDGVGSLAEVNGIVTLDGSPIENIQVLFTPQPTPETSIVGPTSFAKTDTSGKFTLKVKGGKAGAVVGEHKISCQYADYNPAAVQGIQYQLSQKQGDANALKAKLKKLKERVSIPGKFNTNTTLTATVTSSGLKDYKIELTSN